MTEHISGSRFPVSGNAAGAGWLVLLSMCLLLHARFFNFLVWFVHTQLISGSKLSKLNNIMLEFGMHIRLIKLWTSSILCDNFEICAVTLVRFLCFLSYAARRLPWQVDWQKIPNNIMQTFWPTMPDLNLCEELQRIFRDTNFTGVMMPNYVCFQANYLECMIIWRVDSFFLPWYISMVCLIRL